MERAEVRFYQLQTFNFSFFGNFAVIIGFNRSTNNGRDTDHVEKICRNSIGDVCVRLWICAAVECGHRSDWALPRARAQLQLRAATSTAAAPDLLCSSARGWRRRRSGLWLRPAVRILRCPPILRATRSLASTSSLAL